MTCCGLLVEGGLVRFGCGRGVELYTGVLVIFVLRVLAYDLWPDSTWCLAFKKETLFS